MPRSVQIVRVFTRDGHGGNGLGVVNDVTDLPAAEMQAIAANLGFSETTFVDWSRGDVPHVRIFTPLVEMEFAGHPLVGTSWVMNVLGPGGVDRMECPVGPVNTWVEGEIVWIETRLRQDVASHEGDLAVRAGMPQPQRAWIVLMPKKYTVVEYEDDSTIAALP